MTGTPDNTNHYGAALKAAREAKKLNRSAIASQLKLSEDLIRALEAEDVTALPAPTFVRGYIRSYADLVDLPIEALLAAYNATAESVALTDEYQAPNLPKKRHKWLILLPALAIILPLVVALVYFWENSQNLTRPSSANSETSDFDSVPELQLPEINLQPAAPDAADAEPVMDSAATESTAEISEDTEDTIESLTDTYPLDTAPNTDSDNTLAASDPTPTAPESSVPTPTEQAGDNSIEKTAAKLQLSFQGKSWVEVFDADGRRLAFNLYDQNSEPLILLGSKPFQVILGNATQVEIILNQQPFDLQPFIRKNSSARVLVE